MLRDLFSLFPAYAGVILSCCALALLYATFPRIRGGDPPTAEDARTIKKLFPAYAGVIPVSTAASRFSMAFPRIRGGDPSS